MVVTEPVINDGIDCIINDFHNTVIMICNNVVLWCNNVVFLF